MVLSTIALVIFLYLLIFVIFPNTEPLGRLMLAICVPAGLVLLDLGVALEFHGWSGEFVKLLSIAVIVGPFCYVAPPRDIPSWMRGRWRILLIPLGMIGVVMLDFLSFFWPEWQHSKTLMPVVVSFAAVVGLFRAWHRRHI